MWLMKVPDTAGCDLLLSASREAKVNVSSNVEKLMRLKLIDLFSKPNKIKSTKYVVYES